MSKYFGSALDEYIADIPRVIEASLEAVGDSNIQEFQSAENIVGRQFGGRLHDGFSWATSKRASGVGPRAENSDQVAKPTEPFSLNYGTNVPYATVHAYGAPGAGIKFQYGQNGNPANFEALLVKIKEWCQVRGIPVEKAEVIARNIENNEQVAYPYIYETLARIRSKAPGAFTQAYQAHRKSYTNEVDL